ncbi:hypothetical protein DTL42_05055 [Bremerella cremea]|uniref:Uncharacterized protein n=1 Tax=Bremerella cremea TaxID=1031537 RepID=A0A368KVQ6_9BACT|nr:hypothetical protein DTL42_05055 [Bremerella cremea]
MAAEISGNSAKAGHRGALVQFDVTTTLPSQRRQTMGGCCQSVGVHGNGIRACCPGILRMGTMGKTWFEEG